MKQILFLIIALISTVSIKGQTVVIECQGGAGVTTCFLTDPTPFNTIYVANINDGDKTVSNGWNRLQPNWVAVGGTVGALNGGIQTNAQWLNTPNTPQKTIQVVVTYQKAGQNYVVVQNTQNVTVKHIGKILSATIQNGSPSTINGSGLTVQIPCGTAPFSISVPTVVTDPSQTVNYSANVPNGFGVSQTTSTSTGFSITPTAGGGGIVRINAKRTDGTVIQSFDINLSTSASEVGTPTINLAWGGPIVCVGNTRFVTGVAANATSFVWSPVSTATLYAPSTNVNYAYVTFNSKTTLTLTVDNGCGLPKTISKVINVGAPIFSEATVNGAPQQTPNYIQNPAFLSVNSDELTASFNYQIAAYNGSISPISWSHGDRSVYAYAYPFVQIQANTTNICGTNSTMFFLYNVTNFYRMASPNPAQSTISVEMEKELGREALVSVKLISHGRNSVERSFTNAEARRTNHFERSNKVEFDVSNLPRGTYYLMIDFKGEKKFKEIIVLN